MRTAVGATGAAVGVWHWLALVGAAAEATAAISAPVLGGLGVRTAPALAAGLSLSLAAIQSVGTSGVLVSAGAAGTSDRPRHVIGESLRVLHPNGVDGLRGSLGFAATVAA